MKTYRCDVFLRDGVTRASWGSSMDDDGRPFALEVVMAKRFRAEEGVDSPGFEQRLAELLHRYGMERYAKGCEEKKKRKGRR